MATINGVSVIMPPPEGYVVDFDNPQRTGTPAVYFIAGFGGALSLIFFVQRLYVKLFLAGGLQLDDCMFRAVSIIAHTQSSSWLTLLKHSPSHSLRGMQAHPATFCGSQSLPCTQHLT
jgi:hypothetical protein